MTQKETPSLKVQFDEERYKLESAIAAALVEFTERTGFVVEGIQPFYHNYQNQGQAPYYAVSVDVKL